MAKITFAKTKNSIEIKENTSLMKTLLDADVPVASSCGGEGICGKCVIRILDGEDQLSPMNDQELDLMEKIAIPPDGRISCQTQFKNIEETKPIVVDTDYW